MNLLHGSVSSVSTVPARQPATIAPYVWQALWSGSKAWTAGLVIACFPLLFILDGSIKAPVSPVLPGLAAFLLLILGLPFAFREVQGRRYRRRAPNGQDRRAPRFKHSSRIALGVGIALFVGWLAVGA